MLIRTKLLPPRNSFQLVSRTELLEKLNASASGKLTLISAPAGFGKTTLVVNWLEQTETTFAWLSLDENDNNIGLFASYLLAAVEPLFPQAWKHAPQVLSAADLLGVDELAVAFLYDMHAVSEPFVLVIDDYHLIHDANIHDLCRTLVSRLPSHVHIILITRTDPPLPLPKLLISGQASQVRADDLRFSDGEANRFLQINGHDQLEPDAVDRLNQQLEGWIAGLRMVALSLNSVDAEATYLENLEIRTDGFIAEYLVAEVLDHLPAGTRAFLLETSILDRFCAGLCDDVVTAATPSLSTEILGFLHRSNLFLIPLDDRGAWFRYHHLFQKILQQKLGAQTEPRQIAQLHHKAAQWFAQHDLSEEALQHALLADDIDFAVSLVEARSHNLLTGLERRTLERWMDLLPPEIVWQRPKLLMARAWLHYRHWRMQSLDDLLNALETCLDTAESTERRFGVGQIYVLRSATLFHHYFDYAATLATVEQAFSNLQLSERGALGTAHSLRAFARAGHGSATKAIQELVQLMRDPSPLGPTKTQLFLGASLLQFMTGDLVRMGVDLERVDALGDKVTLSDMSGVRWCSGLLAFEQNRLEVARSHSTIMFQSRHASNFLAGFYSAYALIRIKQIEGEFEEAQNFIDQLRGELLRLSHWEFLRQLDALQAYQWLQMGEHTLAHRWAQNYRPEESPDALVAFDPPGLVWVRILLIVDKTGELEAVRTYLHAKMDQIAGTDFRRRRLQLLAHLAAFYGHLGDGDAARASLREALRLGQPGGHIRSFADVGASLLSSLRSLHASDIDPIYKQTIMAAIPDARIAPTMAIATLLTRREQEILNLMNRGLSNQEISTELVISIHTVKRHISNIYDKLTVNNRQQAIFRATELGILA